MNRKSLLTLSRQAFENSLLDDGLKYKIIEYLPVEETKHYYIILKQQSCVN